PRLRQSFNIDASLHHPIIDRKTDTFQKESRMHPPLRVLARAGFENPQKLSGWVISTMEAPPFGLGGGFLVRHHPPILRACAAMAHCPAGYVIGQQRTHPMQ